MDYIGTDFNSTGSVIPKSELTAARLKRGECVTCGRRCFKKKLFKMVPIDDEEAKILNGRCLHCNPLHTGSGSSNHSINKNSKHPSGHSSYNRNSSGHTSSIQNSSQSSNGKQQVLQRSKSYHPNSSGSPLGRGGDSKPPASTPRDSSDGSSPTPLRASSTPPQARSPGGSNNSSSNHGARTDPQYDKRADRSSRTTVSALARNSSKKGLQSDHDDGKLRSKEDHSLRTRSFHQGSFHSVASSCSGDSRDLASSTSSSVTSTRHSHSHGYHHQRCHTLSSKNSTERNSAAASVSNPSKEELQRAALLLLEAAKEQGLEEGREALATSLQDIVNNIAKSSTNDAPHAAIAASRDSTSDGDDETTKDLAVAFEEDSHPRNNNGEKPKVLDRGGTFPMRCGRLIYTGSTRTVSSMSSIDEGDKIHPTANIQFQQHPIRGMGKSSRTLGSLSTIDGANEEDIHSQQSGHDTKKRTSGASTAQDSKGGKLEPGHPPDSNSASSHDEVLKVVGASLESVSLPGQSIAAKKKFHRMSQEERKVHDTEIESILQKLKDSINSSSPVLSMEAMESLSEFLSSFLEDLERHLDLCIEKGLGGILVAIMRNHPDSPEVQAKVCEVLAGLVSCDGSNNQRSASNRLRRSRIIVKNEGAGEAILFSSMILHEDNPRVQEAALNAIQCFCRDSEENQANFWKLDAIEPILRAMEHHPNSARIQETGATVVTMLASSPQNENAKATIGGNGGIPLILRAISIHLADSRVVESCIHALYTLVSEYPQNIDILLKVPGTTKAILDALRSHTQNLSLQEIGCAILVKLTTLSEHTDLLLDNCGSTGGTAMAKDDSLEEKPNDLLECLIETILDTIQTYSTVPVIQDFGFAILANLTDSNETKMFLVDLGALDAIVLAMVLHGDNVGVQERICCLLLLLAVQENHQHILAANPIELVKLAAHKYPEECLEPASRLIRQLGHEL